MLNKVYVYGMMMCLLFVFGASVVSAGAYTIKNIQVQSLGVSSSAAKEMALKDARRQAFHMIVQKLVDKKETDRFDSIDGQTIEFLIDSLQVLNEQMGRKSYKATVSFEFNKQRMEEFLRNKSVPFITPPVHKVILVLPVLSDGAKTYLFEKENLWFDLWKKHSFNQALVTFVVPNGDLSDLSLLDAEDALIGAGHKLVAIAQRYQVSAVIVPYISITKEGRNLNVRLDFQEYDSKGIQKNNAIRSHELTEAVADMSKQVILNKLLPIAIENIQDFCKVQFGGAQEHNLVYLKIPTKSPDDYYKYIQILNDSAMAMDIQPVELSRGFSVLRVKTLYTLEDLLKYFKDRGHSFETSQDVTNPYAYDAVSKK